MSETATTRERHEREVLRLAEEYREQGFDVKVEPRPGTLPPPLESHSPDLFATRGEETHVVEVKVTSTRRDSERWANFARMVEQVPGWHFRLVVLNESVPFKAVSKDLILSQLARAQVLAQQGDTRAALLLAWGLFEAAARLRLSTDGESDPARSSAISLVKRLVQLGYVEQDDVPALQKLSALRSALAHGFESEVPDVDAVATLCSFAARLLEGT